MGSLIFNMIRWNALLDNLTRLINELVSLDGTVRNYDLIRAARALVIDNTLEQMGLILERVSSLEVHTLGDSVFSALEDVAMARDMLSRYKDPTLMFTPLSDVRADFRAVERLFQCQKIKDVSSDLWAS